MLDELIPAYEATLATIGTAMRKSFGDAATWGVAGLREEALVYLLAETMRKLGTEPIYEPCFEDRTRADLKWPHPPAASTSVLEAKWWWWRPATLQSVLANIASKAAFVGHAGERYGLVFSVDDVNCVDGEKTWATQDGARRWMQELLDQDQQLRRTWSFVGCASTKSPYFGTSSAKPKSATQREGMFVAAFYRMKRSR